MAARPTVMMLANGVASGEVADTKPIRAAMTTRMAVQASFDNLSLNSCNVLTFLSGCDGYARQISAITRIRHRAINFIITMEVVKVKRLARPSPLFGLVGFGAS